MRGTPNQRMAVAERAIVLREMEVKVTALPPREEAIPQDIIAKAATSHVKAISPVKAAIVLALIAKALPSLAKVATSPVRVVTLVVPVLPPATTLMPSTA